LNEQQISETAGDLATEVLDVAERLVNVGERLNHLARDSGFIAEARAELEELIEAVELPGSK
jgi:hypothetical protein